MLTREKMFDYLVEFEIATEKEINLVTAITGYNEDALQDILFVRTGNRNFEDLLEEYDGN